MIKSFCLLNTLKKSNDYDQNLFKDSKNNEKSKIFEDKLSFMMCVVGKPGSGKTSVIQELLLNPDLLSGFFDLIFIFSPTPFPFIECILNENWFSSFSITILEEVILNIRNMINKEFQKQIKVLFVFDDLISSFKAWKTSPPIMTLFFNRRHLLPYNSEISIILTAQRYAVIPINYRSCINNLIIFRLNDRDYKFIKEDSVGNLSLKDMNNNWLTNNYDFVYISLNDGFYYKNFLEKLK